MESDHLGYRQQWRESAVKVCVILLQSTELGKCANLLKLVTYQYQKQHLQGGKKPQILGSGTHMSLTKPTPHANCHLVHPAAWPQFTHTTNQLMDNQPTNQPWSYINDNNNK